MLADGGYLLLGSAETYSHDLGILALKEINGVFLYQKLASKNMRPKSFIFPEMKDLGVDQQKSQTLGKIRPFPSKVKKSGHGFKNEVENKKKLSRNQKDHIENAVALAKKKKYIEALNLADKITSNDPDLLQAQNLKANILINLKRSDEAKSVCERTLEKSKGDIECLLLLGGIARSEGNHLEAIKWFRQVVLIQPSSWIAHFYLAEIYRSIGESKPAILEFETTIDLLTRKGMSETGLSLFPFSFFRRSIDSPL